jgi:hypothetical protein
VDHHLLARLIISDIHCTTDFRVDTGSRASSFHCRWIRGGGLLAKQDLGGGELDLLWDSEIELEDSLVLTAQHQLLNGGKRGRETRFFSRAEERTVEEWSTILLFYYA